VLGHEGKCSHPHGHNYVVEITAEAKVLDDVGRVVDFSVLKDRIGAYIEREWDHAFLVYAADTELVDWLRGGAYRYASLPANPTAENLAMLLLRRVAPHVLEGTGVTVRRVRVMETENCWAEDELPG
jgi:6-pyruvoyltetrahydropterin/6-carboxytetrahydropterin synthase